MQFLKNPFYIFILTFLLIGAFYSLHWSLLYPVLSWSLILFFVFAFGVSLFLGGTLDRYNPIEYVNAEKDNVRSIVIILYILTALELIYTRGIPLIMVLSREKYDYTQFGIPVIHPVIATFTSFYTVYVFHLALSARFKKYVLYLILLLLIPLSIFNRGMFLMTLTSFLFVLLMSSKIIKIKRILWIAAFVVLIFYGFGVLGNYRMVRSSSNEYFWKVSGASEEFMESKIPKEFLWSYMYVTSPLANLQYNIDSNPALNTNIKSFLFCELLPDFISKRVSPIVRTERLEKVGVANFLTVGTVFSRSYSALGWVGIFLIFFVIMAFTFVYIIFLNKKNKFYVTGIALINTFILFNFFTNMIYYSGMSLQLIYPIIGYYFVGYRLVVKDKKK